MFDITAIILTKNEEVNIENCIKSVKNFVKRIVVIDSGSTDKTINIAKKHLADVFINEYLYYAQQFNWGINNTIIDTEWILRIDADEVFSEDLWKEIRYHIDTSNNLITGIAIEADLFFMGKKLKYGSSKKRKIMLFKTGFGEIENIKRDAHTIINSGKIVSLKNRFLHKDYKSLEHYIQRYNKYSIFEADDYISRTALISKGALSDRIISRKRNMKFGVYYRFPRFIRAHLWYLYNYYFKLGFLDGIEGKIYNFLECYWYRFLVDANIYEKEKYDE